MKNAIIAAIVAAFVAAGAGSAAVTVTRHDRQQDRRIYYLENEVDKLRCEVRYHAPAKIAACKEAVALAYNYIEEPRP